MIKTPTFSDKMVKKAVTGMLLLT